MELILAFFISLAITGLSGLVIIPWLKKINFGQKILDIGPSWHKNKEGTPTMGGLMFMLGILVATAATCWNGVTSGDWRSLLALFPAYCFGVVGMIDDVAKMKKKQNKGLSVIQKLVLQTAVAAIFVTLLQSAGYLQNEIYIPFINVILPMPTIAYVILAAVFIVFIDNAVNLTDGIDGLACGVTLPISLFFVAVASFATAGMYSGAGIPAAALAGGLAGFLIYNFHPARVFMGDTGSLFLGGMVCGLAFVCDMPLILIPIGIIYIIEALSVMMQVGYFKLTHGKRLFKMAPIHHHFEKSGWSEIKIFTVFTLITVLMCALSYVGLTAGRLN